MRYVVSCAMTSIKTIWYQDYRDFFLVFFYVRSRSRMMESLFFVEKNLIKVSCVPWKDFLIFSGSSVFLKSNFSENFVQMLSTDFDTILLEHWSDFSYRLPKILENFLIFGGCPHISFNVSSHLNIFAIS